MMQIIMKKLNKDEIWMGNMCSLNKVTDELVNWKYE